MNTNNRKLGFVLLLTSLLLVGAGTAISADKDNVTRIHMVEHNGYFATSETLMNLEPGHYIFEVKNEAGKMAGFLVQDLETEEVLAMGAIEPGQKREYEVEISAAGFRYRCPINPTPWYEVNVGRM